jgi:ribosome-associated translation inhibitor RaiA
MIQTPIQISSRGIGLAVWWKDAIQKKIEKLELFHHRITACRVVVETIHQHKGRHYQVRIDLELPGRVIVIDRETAATLDEAIERSFDAAGRRLEDFARRQRGDVKRRARSEAGE